MGASFELGEAGDLRHPTDNLRKITHTPSTYE